MSSEAPSLGGAAGSGEQPRLRWLREVWASTLGKKILVAITGVLLAGYVILHALGNLKGLQGPGDGDPAIDKYAEFLRTVGGPAIPRSGVLWIIRGLLIVELIIHVVGVTQLIKRNRAARPASAKVAHLNSLPQGEPERYDRAHDMVVQHDAEGFGGCSNFGECQAVCPQEISIKVITELYTDYRKAMIHRLRARRGSVKPQ